MTCPPTTLTSATLLPLRLLRSICEAAVVRLVIEFNVRRCLNVLDSSTVLSPVTVGYRHLGGCGLPTRWTTGDTAMTTTISRRMTLSQGVMVDDVMKVVDVGGTGRRRRRHRRLAGEDFTRGSTTATVDDADQELRQDDTATRLSLCRDLTVAPCSTTVSGGAMICAARRGGANVRVTLCDYSDLA